MSKDGRIVNEKERLQSMYMKASTAGAQVAPMTSP
jgi:hypothetical protein